MAFAALGVLLLGRGTAWAEESTESDVRRIEWVVPTLHGIGLLTATRIGEAIIWPEPFARLEPEFWADRYTDAFTMPPKWDGSEAVFEWDGDPWPVNAVGHALLGSELYMRARTCHFGWLGSLAFTAGGTLAWEYAFEANGVRPSGLDLWYTPLSGLALGELRYAVYRGAEAMPPGAGRSVLMAVVDPFGEIERGLGTVC